VTILATEQPVTAPTFVPFILQHNTTSLQVKFPASVLHIKLYFQFSNLYLVGHCRIYLYPALQLVPFLVEIFLPQ